MIINDTLTGLIAVALAYLIGSFPSAYIVTRLAKGKDIRDLGTGHTGRGNVGARNVFVNVGKVPGAIVAILDIAKGAGAILLAEWLLGGYRGLAYLPRPSDPQLSIALVFALAAGLAAIVGHIWPVYIRFKGGAGLATAIGVMAIVLTREVTFALAITVVLMYVTRNVILSANLSMLTIPIWAALDRLGWWMVVYPLVAAVVMFWHFLPNILAEVKKAGAFDRMVGGLIRRGPRGR
jgi:glycerol-3-phosphate acyltransferase PlsY